MDPLIGNWQSALFNTCMFNDRKLAMYERSYILSFKLTCPNPAVVALRQSEAHNL